MFFLGVLLGLCLLGAVAQRLDEDLRSFVTVSVPVSRLVSPVVFDFLALIL